MNRAGLRTARFSGAITGRSGDQAPPPPSPAPVHTTPKPPKTLRKRAHRDVPGTLLCRKDAAAPRCAAHNGAAGHSTGTTSRAGSPSSEAGRRRASSLVAAFPVTPERPRCLRDAGTPAGPAASQKAGVTGSVTVSVAVAVAGMVTSWLFLNSVSTTRFRLGSQERAPRECPSRELLGPNGRGNRYAKGPNNYGNGTSVRGQNLVSSTERGKGAWLQLCSPRIKLRAWHPLPSRHQRRFHAEPHVQ
jgi:hypothetical protein